MVKRKLSPVIILLTLLFFAALTRPNVVTANEDKAEKSLVILNDVIGINTTAYSFSFKTNQQRINTPFEEITDLSLTSNTSNLRAMCTFLKNSLQQVFIAQYSELPKLNQHIENNFDDAFEFLGRYETYANTQVYGTMKSMVDADKSTLNETKIMGNIKLTVLHLNQSIIQYTWTYVDNEGIPAPSKSVLLEYQNGLFRCFQDNWQFYTIAIKPEISKERAVTIALHEINDYSAKVLMSDNRTSTISGFEIASIGETSLCYLNDRKIELARNGNPFILYPSWDVPLGFDKVYEGGVSGATVRLWADNGELCAITPMIVGYSSPSTDQSKPGKESIVPSSLLLVGVACCVVFGTFWSRAILLKTRSKRRANTKLIVSLICFSISVSAFSIAVPNVEASKKSWLYASTYGQLYDECTSAYWACDYIESLFSYTSYSVTNAYGSGTVKDSILANAEYSEDNFDNVTVFHFGHMYGANHLWDDGGVDVSYSDIAQVTSLGKHNFVFLWTCSQGEDMANAWAQDIYDGDHCFFGFDGASPTLLGYSFRYQSCHGEDVIYQFYYYTLGFGYSANDALDLMSYYCFYTDYENSVLCNGYQTWWPYDFGPGMTPDWYGGCMIVYGNGDICLV